MYGEGRATCICHTRGLGTVFAVSVADDVEHIKKIVNASEGYEFTCLLTSGFPEQDVFLPKQREINIHDRIHAGTF